jgi:hypothetical protein
VVYGPAVGVGVYGGGYGYYGRGRRW